MFYENRRARSDCNQYPLQLPDANYWYTSPLCPLLTSLPGVKPVGDNIKYLRDIIKPLGVIIKPLRDNIKPLGVIIKPLGVIIKPLGVIIKPLRAKIKYLGVRIKALA